MCLMLSVLLLFLLFYVVGDDGDSYGGGDDADAVVDEVDYVDEVIFGIHVFCVGVDVDVDHVGDDDVFVVVVDRS